MKKARIVVSAGAAIGMLVFSMTPAQAGGSFGGGNAADLNTFYECQVITGKNVNLTVDLVAPGVDPTPETPSLETLRSNVRVNSPALVCSPVNVKQNGAYVSPPTSAGLLKCYTTTDPSQQGAVTFESLTDAFLENLTTQVQQPVRYLCSPATLGE